jgi:hypothetical protein
MYCFCGGVASFNVFCVLVTYPPGRRPGGEFLAVHSTATELWWGAARHHGGRWCRGSALFHAFGPQCLSDNDPGNLHGARRGSVEDY